MKEEVRKVSSEIIIYKVQILSPLESVGWDDIRENFKSKEAALDWANENVAEYIRFRVIKRKIVDKVIIST